MLPLQFIEENLHFAISLFAALVSFAVFWLYLDAWLAGGRKNHKEIYKWAGFFAVSLSFIVNATIIEQDNFGHSVFGGISVVLASALRLIGYALIIVGQLTDPLQERPKQKSLEEELGLEAEQPQANKPKSSRRTANSIAVLSGVVKAVAFLPIGALAIAVLYWRRATSGLERHLKPVALAFALLFLFELTSLAELYRGTSNPQVYSLVRAFGPFWIISYLALLVAMVVLGRWVWKYLTERFFSQLFMIFTSAVLVVFLITTVSFTFLLLNNVQNDALDNLQTAGDVLGYALNSRQAVTLASADEVAGNPQVIQAVEANNHASLDSLTSTILADKGLSNLDITSAQAQVLERAENPDRWGDSISSDAQVRRALIGESDSAITSGDGVLAPTLYIRSVVPIKGSDGSVVGTVSATIALNNTFVDGLKNATGLESAIYSGNICSATTLLAPDGVTHWVGLKEENKTVLNTVLRNGKTYKGSLNILNQQYLATYIPFRNVNNQVVGMLFIGEPETTILQTTAHSIELTFIVASILLVLAILPAYLISKYIARQLE